MMDTRKRLADFAASREDRALGNIETYFGKLEKVTARQTKLIAPLPVVGKLAHRYEKAASTVLSYQHRVVVTATRARFDVLRGRKLTRAVETKGSAQTPTAKASVVTPRKATTRAASTSKATASKAAPRKAAGAKTVTTTRKPAVVKPAAVKPA
jgi:hypothetical protein